MTPLPPMLDIGLMRAPKQALSFSPLFAFSWLLAITLSGCNAELESVCYGACQGTGGGPTSANGGSGGAGGTGGTVDMCSDEPASGDFPCDVYTILQAKCLNCHNADHLNGAPIDLLACERFHEQDCNGIKTRFRIAKSHIESGFMPIGDTLTDTEKQTLLDWLSGCGLCESAGSTGCGEAPGAKACYEK
ncbi:MAG: hypothetical protein IPK82_15345 [Polyangiaceae bacterium]|nr:hypothetical protein [Polyangiaceae bacterium]